jgi:putative Mg2+ transporter-C (MgtC) family protein
VWVTAAIGMACGAGLALIAVVATAGHFVVVPGYPALAARLPNSRFLGFAVRIVYEDGRGILRDVLAESPRRGFAIVRVGTQQLERGGIGGVPAVAVMLEVEGKPPIESLAAALDDVDGVLEVTTSDLAQGAD